MTDVADVLSPELDDSEPETKGERTRRRILEIAVDRFGRRGFKSTSVSEIARAAGLTQAASYAYFDSKEVLFKAAVDTDATAMISQVAEQLDDLPIDRVIPSIVLHAMVALEDHPLAKRVLAGEEPDEVARLVELPALALFSDIIASRLAAAQDEGLIRRDFDPTVVAGGVEGLVLGLLFMMVQANGVSAPRHAPGVVAAFDLMLHPGA